MRRLWPIILLIILSGCTKKQPAMQYFVAETATRVIYLDQVIDRALEEYGKEAEDFVASHQEQLDKYRSVVYPVEACSITYNTVTPAGEKVVASGVVYVPLMPTISGVLELMPVSRYKGDAVTADPLSFDAFASFLGYVCLSTDQIGAGTTESYPLNSFQHDNIITVCAHFRKAADEYLRTVKGKLLPKYSIIAGYSMGASAALGLARYYSRNPDEGISVQALHIGGGIYELAHTLEWILEKGTNRYCVLPTMLWSMDQWDHVGFKPEEAFLPELQKREDIYKGYVYYFDAASILGENLAGYLDYNYFKESNPAYRAILENAKAKDIPLQDWTPQFPIYITSAQEDDFIDSGNSDRLYQALKAKGANVQYQKQGGDHVTAGGYFLVSIADNLL